MGRVRGPLSCRGACGAGPRLAARTPPALPFEQGFQMHVRVGALVVVAAVAVLGCGGGRGGTDDGPDGPANGDWLPAGAACIPNLGADRCDRVLELKCIDGHCKPVCEGVYGGTVCGGGPSLETPLQCCTQAERCCPAGGETSVCVPDGQPCPIVCGFTACGQTEWCAVCSACPGSAAPCVGRYSCAADCPPERQCGAHDCCGAGTRCAGAYCEEACGVDGGPDGPPDAAGD